MKNFQQVLNSLRETPRTWLITGAAGYVGTQLTKILLDHNQKVIAFDNYECAQFKITNEFEDYFPKAQHKQLEVWHADVRNEYDIHYAMSRKDVKHVIHLAALRSVPHSYDNPVEVTDVNVMGTMVVANEAVINNVDSFVYASSSSVYGNNVDNAQYEWMPCYPVSPYAKSKFAAEQLVATLNRGDTAITGLRFFNIYGPNQDGFDSRATVIPKFVDRIVTNQPIQIYGNSAIERDFVHVKDIIQGIIRAALFSKKSTADIYNIGSGNSFTLYYIVDKIDKILKSIFDFRNGETINEYLPERIGDVPYTRACISKAREDLGYDPYFDIDEGLKKVIYHSIRQHKPEWITMLTRIAVDLI